jgi:penicillin-binding protein 1A
MPTVADYARRFGITSPVLPFLPVALGAADVTLYEQTSAYTVFPNDGLRIEPRYIRKVTDYEGHVLEQDFPDAKDVISQRTARTMVSLLEEVVKHGTASSAKKLNHPVAGKTGTTNDYTDAWFVGFTPSLTCGVWVGYDEKKDLGEGETGGHAALPIWMDFMRAVVSDPARKGETFPTTGIDKKKTAAIKRAAITPPRHAGDAEAH